MTPESPFESPIEEHLAAAVQPHLADGVDLIEQRSVETRAGTFRLDFMAVTAAGLRIGIECDGMDFHDQARDEWRDAMILGDGRADSIVRLRAQDIWYHRDDALYLLGKLYPPLFSARGKGVFERLVSDRVAKLDDDTLTGHYIHFYYTEFAPGQDAPFDFKLFNRSRMNKPGTCQFWNRLYQFAVKDGGNRLDDMMARFHAG